MSDYQNDTVSQNFQDYIASEHKRLANDRNALCEEIASRQKALAEIDREYAAIDAYEAAKLGKSAPAKGTSAPRARRGSRREAIVTALSEAPTGMSRGELLEAFEVKGDKSAEMSISNALTALTKTGALVREGGKYHVPATPLHAAA